VWCLASTSKQIESKYMDKKGNPWEIHTHAYSHSFHHTILLIKRKTPLYGKHTFKSTTINHKKRKDFPHNPLLGHKEKVHTTCPLHVLLLIQRKQTFIRDQMLPK
jgi:hypothetical protein